MGWREHRYAPALGTLLCRLDGVADGACKELRFGEGDGMLSVLLHRLGETVRGYVNSCPHFSLPLNAQPDQFLLLANGRIMCAWHCAVFRLDDGHCVAGPAKGLGLEPLPLHIRDGSVYLGDA
jgi:nitrite reductase/ring-hydroxylating ferredoxin subunit